MQRFDIYDLTDEQINNLSEQDIILIAQSFDWDKKYQDKFNNKEDFYNFIKNKTKEKRDNFLQKKPYHQKFFETFCSENDYKELKENQQLLNEYLDQIKSKYLEIGKVYKELKQ